MLLVFEEYVQNQIPTLLKIASFICVDGVKFENMTAAAENISTGSHYLKFQNVEKLADSGLFQSIRAYIPAGIRQPVRRAV